MRARTMWLAFFCRIGLAAIMVQQGVYSLAPALAPGWAGGVVHHTDFGPFHALIIWPLAALLLFLGTWLLIGLCSRIVAAWSAIAMIGLGAACMTQAPMHADCHGVTLVAVMLAVPVLWFGGGHFAVVRRGWSVPF